MAEITPWTGFKREMDRLFDRMRGDWELPALKPIGEWMPSLDVTEGKDAYVVKAEVPGIEPKEVQVSVDDGVLTIKGEKRQEKEEKAEKAEHYYRAECSYGAFARSVRLPGPVDGGKVSASMKNGVLVITLPKTAAAKGTEIRVTAG